MLTPKFKLSQDHEHLYLRVHVPYIKHEEADCEINDNVFYFSAPPYYLRLHLPGEVLIDTGPSSYDVDSGDLTINLKKKNKGEFLEGLDMLTWLLTPRKTKPQAPNIEVISKTENVLDEVISKNENVTDENMGVINKTENITNVSKSNSSNEEEILDSSQVTVKSIENASYDSISTSDEATISADDEEVDWFIDQEVKELDVNIPGLEAKTRYGFALRRFNFGDVNAETGFVTDIRDPDNLSLIARRQLRQEQEDSKFDCEHYLADLFDEDDMIKELLVASYPELTGTDGIACELNDKESEKLMQLPKREYLIEPEILPQLYLGLVDLIFAYAYNFRFAHGEDNVESYWTICKLSSTLSWFDSFSDLKDVGIACARRSLCFPLYRSWVLFEKIFHDVNLIFKCGQKQILKCLLGIHFILQRSEEHHVLNELYITDYCVWIQSTSCEQIEKLANDLSNLQISKTDINFHFKLSELDADAKNMMKGCGEDDIDVLADKVKNVVNVNDVDEDSDDDESEHDESDDDEDDSNEDEDDSDKDDSDDDDTEDDSDHDDGSDEEENTDKGKNDDNGVKGKDAEGDECVSLLEQIKL